MFQHAILNAKEIALVDVVGLLVVKDIIVIFRKKRNYFDFNQLKTLFFASWKLKA